MSAWAFVLLSAVVLVGSLLQVAIGFGLGLIAAPVVAIVEPSLVPVVLLVLACGVTSADLTAPDLDGRFEFAFAAACGR